MKIHSLYQVLFYFTRVILRDTSPSTYIFPSAEGIWTPVCPVGYLYLPVLFTLVGQQLDNFLQVYQNGLPFGCLMINSAGNVQQCSISNVLCEKSLIRDVRICLNKNSLATTIITNSTTLINLSTYATASSCIEYCRGTIGNQV